MFGLTAANIADLAMNFKERESSMYRFVLRIVGLVCSISIVILDIVQAFILEKTSEPSNIS